MRRWLLLLSLLSAAPLQAQTNCIANPASCSTTTGAVQVSITIGRAFQLTLSPGTTNLATPTPAIYDAGYSATNGPTATIKSNAPWTLAISSSTSSWGAVDSGTEPAWTAKPSTDLQWATASAGPFGGVTTSAATVTTGTATANSSVTLFYRTLYKWSTDTPGTYSLTVIFTITSP